MLENRYDTASMTNGTARDTAYRAPPAGGPTRRWVARRASFALKAAGSCAVGTTDRNAPDHAALKSVAAAPSTNPSTKTCQTSTTPVKISTASKAIVTAPIASDATIRPRRLHVSDATPASTPKRPNGARRASPTAPAQTAE